MHGADFIVGDGTASLPQHRAQRTMVVKKVEPAHRASAAEIDAGVAGTAEKFGEVAIYALVAMSMPSPCGEPRGSPRWWPATTCPIRSPAPGACLAWRPPRADRQWRAGRRPRG